MAPAGRALIGLWATVLLLVGGGAVVLAVLGPPKPPMHVAGSGTLPARQPPKLATMTPVAEPPITGPQVAAPPVALSSLVAPPDPELLEPAPDFDGRMLPRIGADGRSPSLAYASHASLPAHGPRIAILLEGLGLADAVSQDAIHQLPAAISLGVSPYASSLAPVGPDPLLEAARQAGHETWLSLPMEPAGSPLDDEGPQALTTAIDFDLDRRALEWSLSRLQGYVGVTNALSGLRGDRFSNSTAFSMVRKALSDRGLLYLDAGTTPHTEATTPVPAGTRRADLTIDEQPDAADIEARLSRLEQIAQAQGSALGVAGPLRPVTIERLRAWSRHLAARGIVLVPVSALPPPVRAHAAPPLPTDPPTPVPPTPTSPASPT